MIELKNNNNIEVPEKCMFLFTEDKWKYYVLYGGRGSSKSVSIALKLITLSLQEKCKILCCRQLQNSINESVHALIKELVNDLQLDKYFNITRDSIKTNNGSEFIFKGLQSSINEIKSMQGIKYCWIEEASSVTQETFETLVPTIRVENAKFFISFNPDKKSDYIYQHFIIENPKETKAVLVNYTDNPYFPDVLRKEMEQMKEINYTRYLHIWEGEVNVESGNLIKMSDFNRYKVSPERFDRVFITSDTAFTTKQSSDFTVFCLVGIIENKLYILDVYCKRVNFPDLRRDLTNFYKRYKAQYYNLDTVYIENKGSGISLIQQLREDNLPIMELHPTVTNKELKKDVIADKYLRYLEVEADLKSGRMYIPEYATWLPEFTLQCENFDGGTSKQTTHDDIVDACIIYPLKLYRNQKEVDWIAIANKNNVKIRW